MDLTDYALKREKFYSIWGKKIEDNFDEFKVRVLIDIKEIFDDAMENIYLDLYNINYSYCKLKACFADEHIIDYTDFQFYHDILDASNLFELCDAIQHFLWVSLDDEFSFIQEELINSLTNLAKTSNIPINVKVGSDINILPIGAKSLDEKLVYDIYDWLDDYPKSKERYKSSISKIINNEDKRDIIDNLRLSLELFLKDIFNNKKSLENQDLGKFLKEKNISVSIRNLITTCITYYCNYNNDHAKHNNNVNEPEVEFLLYITGVLIRTIITLKD